MHRGRSHPPGRRSDPPSDRCQEAPEPSESGVHRGTAVGEHANRSTGVGAPPAAASPRTTVQSLRRRAWGGPQLVAQAPSQRLVDEQRLRGVSARLERLHQQPVPALAVGRALDQLARSPFGRVELAAADRDACSPDELERTDEDLVEPAALLVDPRRILSPARSRASPRAGRRGRVPTRRRSRPARSRSRPGGGLPQLPRGRSRRRREARAGCRRGLRAGEPAAASRSAG